MRSYDNGDTVGGDNGESETTLGREGPWEVYSAVPGGVLAVPWAASDWRGVLDWIMAPVGDDQGDGP